MPIKDAGLRDKVSTSTLVQKRRIIISFGITFCGFPRGDMLGMARVQS